MLYSAYSICEVQEPLLIRSSDVFVLRQTGNSGGQGLEKGRYQRQGGSQKLNVVHDPPSDELAGYVFLYLHLCNVSRANRCT